MAKDAAVITEVAPKKKFRLVEIMVDENLTKIRRLVPAETDEDDLPEGHGVEIYSVEETDLALKRQSRPPILLRGHSVRLKPTPDNPISNNNVSGSVAAIKKSGKIRVEWDNGTISTHDITELDRIY